VNVGVENHAPTFLYHGIVPWSVSPRKFNLFCILAVIAVGAAAMVMIEVSPSHGAIDLPAATTDGDSTVMVVQPLDLGMALAITVDMGLMTAGLVILFKDASPGRYRAR
jgi:hypothetical protein